MEHIHYNSHLDLLLELVARNKIDYRSLFDTFFHNYTPLRLHINPKSRYNLLVGT